MLLGKPIIRSFENGGSVYPWSPGTDYYTPDMFEELAGISSDPDALATYLQSNFGLQNPQDYTEFFMQYDPAKQEQLGKTYGTALDVAGESARANTFTTFEEARKAGAMGGGFGGVGRTLETALGRTLSEQEQAQNRAQQSLYGGVFDEQQQYVDDFMQMVGQLGDMGAQFCTEGEHFVVTDEATGAGTCEPGGPTFGDVACFDPADPNFNTDQPCEGETVDPVTCTDVNADNYGAEGDCIYDGSGGEGTFVDCPDGSQAATLAECPPETPGGGGTGGTGGTGSGGSSGPDYPDCPSGQTWNPDTNSCVTPHPGSGQWQQDDPAQGISGPAIGSTPGGSFGGLGVIGGA